MSGGIRARSDDSRESHALRLRPRAARLALLLPLLGLCAAVVACQWDHLDAVDPGELDTGVAGSETGGAAPDTGAEPPDTGAPALDSAADLGTADVVLPGPDAPPSDLPCTSTAPPARQWTFDADVQGWTLSTDTGVRGTVTWTGGTGNASPGALQVDVTPGAAMGAWLEYATSLGDLSGHTLSAWVWLDSGPSPGLKPFVQTGSQWAWADNGTVHLAPRTWTCVSIPVSSPSYMRPNYDPTSVVQIGFEMLGSAPFRVYVDSVRY